MDSAILCNTNTREYIYINIGMKKKKGINIAAIWMMENNEYLTDY